LAISEKVGATTLYHSLINKINLRFSLTAVNVVVGNIVERKTATTGSKLPVIHELINTKEVANNAGNQHGSLLLQGNC
jgi:hypothetical protein